MKNNELQTEWQLLQNQYDQYEKVSLVIKLFAIAVLVAGYLADSLGVFLILILAVIWLQEAIWKTFQARIETRLLSIEQALRKPRDKTESDDAQEPTSESTSQAFQFNSEFANNRSGISGLVTEYLTNGLKPTVAYPHLALILLAFLALPF